MTPSLEGWPTKAKEAPSPHEVRLSLVDTNPVFQCVGVVDFIGNQQNTSKLEANKLFGSL